MHVRAAIDLYGAVTDAVAVGVARFRATRRGRGDPPEPDGVVELRTVVRGAGAVLRSIPAPVDDDPLEERVSRLERVVCGAGAVLRAPGALPVAGGWAPAACRGPGDELAVESEEDALPGLV